MVAANSCNYMRFLIFDKAIGLNSKGFAFLFAVNAAEILGFQYKLKAPLDDITMDNAIRNEQWIMLTYNVNKIKTFPHLYINTEVGTVNEFQTFFYWASITYIYNNNQNQTTNRKIVLLKNVVFKFYFNTKINFSCRCYLNIT